jgi:hypothetical protein
MRIAKLKPTPITEETFRRQKWFKHLTEDESRVDYDTEVTSPYFFILPIPKERRDRYSPFLVSNSSDELETLRTMGLLSGQYFVEIIDMDGLGFCTTEEELEILYRALTQKNLEE